MDFNSRYVFAHHQNFIENVKMILMNKDKKISIISPISSHIK